MAYTPDASNSSQPTDDVKASTAAAEFRALKAALQAAIIGSSALLGNAMRGLTISTAGSTATIAAGQAMDSGNSVLMNFAGMSKTNAAWVAGSGNGGLDTGAFTAAGQYTFYLIRNPSTLAVDAIYSLNTTAPLLPSGYTEYRRIGARFVTASAYTPCLQVGDVVTLDTPQQIYSSAAPGAGSGLVTATVPTGYKLRALLSARLVGADYLRLSDPDQPDLVADSLTSQLASNTTGVELTCMTNTSGQIRRRVNTGATALSILSHGWIDTRGRDV